MKPSERAIREVLAVSRARRVALEDDGLFRILEFCDLLPRIANLAVSATSKGDGPLKSTISAEQFLEWDGRSESRPPFMTRRWLRSASRRPKNPRSSSETSKYFLTEFLLHTSHKQRRGAGT
jgi:hypothetical protein